MRARGEVRGDCAVCLVVTSKRRGLEELISSGFVVMFKGARVLGGEVAGVRGMAVVESMAIPKETNDNSCIASSNEWDTPYIIQVKKAGSYKISSIWLLYHVSANFVTI